MISPENKKILEQLVNSQYGSVLREYLEEELKELQDVSNATSWEDTQGRQKAVAIIRKLFSFMEKRLPVERNKNNYE